MVKRNGEAVRKEQAWACTFKRFRHITERRSLDSVVGCAGENTRAGISEMYLSFGR